MCSLLLSRDEVPAALSLLGPHRCALHHGLAVLRIRTDQRLPAAFLSEFTVTRLLDRFYLCVRDVRRAPVLYRSFFEWIAYRYDQLIERSRNVGNITFLLRQSIRCSRVEISHILDYGCGTGLSMQALRALRWPEGLPRLTGVDTCPQMRRRARMRQLRTVSPEQLHVRRVPCFSAIVASYVLHLPTALSGVEDAWRLLIPGGVFIGNCHKGLGFAETRALLRSLGAETRRLQDRRHSLAHGHLLVAWKP